jgi:hypothetical protein
LISWARIAQPLLFWKPGRLFSISHRAERVYPQPDCTVPRWSRRATEVVTGANCWLILQPTSTIDGSVLGAVTDGALVA